MKWKWNRHQNMIHKRKWLISWTSLKFKSSAPWKNVKKTRGRAIAWEKTFMKGTVANGWFSKNTKRTLKNCVFFVDLYELTVLKNLWLLQVAFLHGPKEKIISISLYFLHKAFYKISKQNIPHRKYRNSAFNTSEPKQFHHWYVFTVQRTFYWFSTGDTWQCLQAFRVVTTWGGRGIGI